MNTTATSIDAIATLKKVFQIEKGTRLYTVLKHVSKSGMTRDIAVLVADKNGNIYNISFYVANALGWTWREDNSVRVGGCGMDMGFHLVYSLARRMFADASESGYCLTQSWL